MIKQLFLDLETTGTNTTKCGIWQIGGIIRYEDVYKEFEFNCDIFDDDEVTSDALEKTGLTFKTLSTFPDPEQVYSQLLQVLGDHVDKYNKQDKFFIIGYGVEFDVKCLRRWFEGFGDNFFGSWLWMPWICVMTLAGNYMKDIRHTMPNFQLKTVLEYLKIDHDDSKLHGALYDAKMAMAIYDLITKKDNPKSLTILPGGNKVYRLKK